MDRAAGLPSAQERRLARRARKDLLMDAVFLLVTAAFFAATWGLVRLCEKV